ncbi:uncharacterized protein LOC113291450 [Papaver somniferum]|uniref:uncharacterized protein LOC113291450 n=1 Tax=Papaver somniferum TaxID=3469 RepID=UPI000E6F8C99|nr:uncharacterized protein LOC113291450 [Papaver somniferum]
MSRYTFPSNSDEYFNNVVPCISDEENDLLTAIPTHDEIKNDNIVMAHELIDTMKKTKSVKGWMALKLDMSKAFDRVEWIFVLNSLNSLSFSQGWCDLISQCIKTVSTSILLNGSPGEVYKPQRDDFLLFARSNPEEASNIATIIEQFSKYSGQSVNFEKSGLAFSPKVPNNINCEISNILHIQKMALQDEYLGVPLLLQKNKVESFNPLMDRFSDRLSPWKSKYITQPGKTTLTQSVLGTIASHHMVVFPMPKAITDKMDVVQRNFFWNKRNGEKGLNIKKWNHIAYPKDLGGLNIRQSAILNQALLAKLSWRMDIQDIRIPISGNDVIRWKPAANGKFSVKSAYRAILDNAQPIPQNSEEIVWKDLWKTNLPIKVLQGESNGARGCCTRALDPEQAEALATFEAIRWAKVKGVRKLHLEGDSQRVVKAINGSKGIVNWTNEGILRDSISSK